VPDLDYATTRDGSQVAFRAYSTGPGEPLLYLPGLLYSIESIPDDPLYARLINGLAELRPLVLVERRGIGASDPVDWSGDVWEQWASDVVAVIDHLGAERASVMSYSVGAAIALEAAARFADRVSSVIGLHPAALVPGADKGVGSVRMTKVVDRDPEAGHKEMVAAFPSRVHDEGFVDWFTRVGRVAASPANATRFWDTVFSPTGLRDRLGDIDASVLLICRRDYVDLAGGVHGFLEVATWIPNSTAVVLDGADLMANAGDIDGLVFEVAEFLDVAQRTAKPSRPLAALLFTDLVGSTETVRSMGDADWRTVLDRHDQLIDRTVRRHGGTMVKATGDGALMTFDSPSRALRCATALRDQLFDLGLGVRMGAHLGEIEGRGADIAGVAVHLVARVMSLASRGQILTTAAMPLATLGGGFDFQSRGHHRMKGFEQEFEVFELSDSAARLISDDAHYT
jgi:class 3 adenylate cyclase